MREAISLSRVNYYITLLLEKNSAKLRSAQPALEY